MAFLKKFLTFFVFWLKNAIFSENFGDLSGLSQICKKKFENFLTPPPTIFGQAHLRYGSFSGFKFGCFW
jgi:hypothetical protein